MKYVVNADGIETALASLDGEAETKLLQTEVLKDI